MRGQWPRVWGLGQRSRTSRFYHMSTIRSITAGRLFEDKCGIIVVDTLVSVLCVATIAGAGRPIVPVAAPTHYTIPPVVKTGASGKKSAGSSRLSQAVVDKHEIMTRALYAEEQAAVKKLRQL